MGRAPRVTEHCVVKRSFGVSASSYCAIVDIDPFVRSRYLARLDAQDEPPSLTGLRELHRRHAERVPYETLWIHGGEQWGIDPQLAAERIAVHGRGGYCYHLNGAFGLLLTSLGYRVGYHTGGVHGPDGPDPTARGNHLVLTVDGLPSDDNPSGRWYVDVGLGDALYEPVALRATMVRQGPFILTLDQIPLGEPGWHLQHDPDGGFTGMTWTMEPPDQALMQRQHEWLSTSPDSGFVKLGLAQTRDADGVDVMHGLVLKRIGSDARSIEPIRDRRAWFEALHDMFGLRFDASAPGTADELWRRTVAAHEAWERADSQRGT